MSDAGMMFQGVTENVGNLDVACWDCRFACARFRLRLYRDFS